MAAATWRPVSASPHLLTALQPPRGSLRPSDPLPPRPTDARRSALLHRLSSPRLSRVTARVQHALLSRSPRSRYAAGWDALLFLLPLSYCPTWLCDAFVAFLMPKPDCGTP